MSTPGSPSPSGPDLDPGHRRNRNLLAALAVVLVVVGVVAVVVIGTRSTRPADPAAAAAATLGRSPTPTQPTPTSTTPAATPSAVVTPGATGPTGPTGAPAVPKGAAGFGGPMVVSPGATPQAPLLEIFEDPQCPICAHFQEVFGSTITAMAQGNEARIQVWTMSFLDANLRNDSSLRAANGAFCAADQGRFLEYAATVYANQPVSEGTGWTDEQLAGFARQVGLEGAALAQWTTCQAALTYHAHVDAVEAAAERRGVTGTPTVKLDGAVLQLSGLTAADFRAKVTGATR